MNLFKYLKWAIIDNMNALDRTSIIGFSSLIICFCIAGCSILFGWNVAMAWVVAGYACLFVTFLIYFLCIIISKIGNNYKEWKREQELEAIEIVRRLRGNE